MPKALPISIRLDSDLLDHLRNLAKAQNRNLNNLIKTVLQEYVEEYELLSNPEFCKALRDAETDEGIPWREALKIV